MEISTIGLIAALLSGVAFALYQISIKRLHGALPLAHPFLFPAFLGFLFPAWLAVFWGSTGWMAYTLTPQALQYPALWALCTILSTTGLVWLLGRFSLSEVAGYKKGLITLGAMGADVLLFGLHFPLFTLLAIGLLLSGALGLSASRSRMPTGREFLIIALWCAVLVVQISLYKKGQMLQPSIMAHTILAQTMATGGYALLWLLPQLGQKLRRQKMPNVGLVLALWATFAAGTLLEGFAYAGLPLALVLVVTMLPAALMAAHDLWRGDLPNQRRSWVSLGLLLAGFVVLMAAK